MYDKSVKPLAAPEKLETRGASGPINEVFFKGYNLMHRSFVCGKSLWGGETPATKNMSKPQVLRLSHEQGHSQMLGLHVKYQKLLAQSVHILHHVLLALKPAKAAFHSLLPIPLVTLPVLNHVNEILSIDHKKSIWVCLVEPCEIRLQATKP